MTLASEDANSKLVEVVTVADVDDEERVGNSHTSYLSFFLHEQNFRFMTKPRLPNLQQALANTIPIVNISNSNNLNKF